MNALTLEGIDSYTKSEPLIGVPGAQCTKCALCSHYQLHGRRGGNCQLLNITVRGGWKACSFAMSPFATSWDSELVKRSPVEFLN
ncbi:MAG TPA: hypothetical protein VK211_20315 [Kamptonema sp.]|nr:hypothetical protein [Kamptonema sp.]